MTHDKAEEAKTHVFWKLIIKEDSIYNSDTTEMIWKNF